MDTILSKKTNKSTKVNICDSRKCACSKINDLQRFTHNFPQLNSAVVGRAEVCGRSTATANIVKSLQCSWLNFSIFPKVSAETVNNDMHVKRQTMMDLLMSRKPEYLQKGLLVTESEVLHYIANESGMDRLKFLYTKSFDNSMHPDFRDMQIILYYFVIASFIGSAMVGSKRAKDKFIRKNKMTKWESPYQAARRSIDTQFFGGARNGLIWVVKMQLFVAPLLFVSQSISMYRNKSSPIDYGIGTAVSGAIYNFMQGPKKMMFGALYAGILGLFSGVVVVAGLKAVGATQESRHYWHITDKLQTEREIAAVGGKKPPMEQPLTSGNIDRTNMLN